MGKKDSASEKEDKDIIFGKFWQVKPKSLSIHHDGLIILLTEAGFFWSIKDNVPILMKSDAGRIHETNMNEVTHYMYEYLTLTVPQDLQHGYTKGDLKNLFVRGVTNYLNWHKLRFLPISKIELHRDTKTESFFYFKNHVVRVTADSITTMDYESIKGSVWAKQVSPYEFTLLPEDSIAGQYETFCLKVCNNDPERFKSLQSIIGYLLHRYFSPSNTVIPCFLDETVTGTDEAEGGTGKTIICQAFEYIRNVVTINGKTFDPYSTFPFQQVERGTDIVFIDDLDRGVPFEAFFSIMSTGLEVNQKGKPLFRIPREESPKYVIDSNFPIRSIAGNSTERRKIEFEVSQYFNKKRSVKDEFCCDFFTDWDKKEFNAMFNFLARCSRFYLKHGIIKPPSINTELRRLIGLIGADLKEFLDEKLSSGNKKFDKAKLYQEFRAQHPGQQKYYASQNKFIMKVHKYFDYNKIEYKETPASTKKTIEIISNPLAKGTEQARAIKGDYKIVNTKEKRQELLNILAASDRFVFDTETAPGEWGDALTIHSLNIVGISFSVKEDKAFYLPLPEDEATAAEILQEFAPVFENEKIIKAGHNLKFDIQVMRRYGINIKGQVFDTLIAHYLCDPEAPHGLKELSLALLGLKQTEIEELIGKGKKQSMRDVPVDKAANYACQDSDATFQLMLKLESMLKEAGVEKLFNEVETKLVYVLADMEYTGIKVDYDVLGNIFDLVEPMINDLAKKIHEIAGREFNINSSAQLSDFLYNDLGLPIKGKTKSGEPSTDKHVLYKLKDEHPVIQLVSDYKELSTVRSNYLLGLPEHIHPDTEKVHTHFNQAIAATGRLSSSDPNLQSISRRSEIGKKIRAAFVPTDANHKIVSADYSQIEIRVMADFSKDPALLQAFNDNIDIHRATASKIFGIPADQITKKQRDMAKSINFGLNYGMGSDTLADYIYESTGEKISTEEAEEYKQKYFEELKAVAEFQEKACELASEKGYSETLFGRRRYIPDINDSNEGKRSAAMRMAMNSPVQGSASDIIKIAMVNIFDRLTSGSYKAKLLIQVHDELVFDVPVDELDAVKAIIKDCMEGVIKLSVPLLVEIGVGDNWLDAH